MRQTILSYSHADEGAAAPMDWRMRGEVYRRFWTQLLARSRDKTLLFARKPPAAEYHLHTSAGRSGFSVGYTLSVHGWASVDLCIDMGDKASNKQAFGALFERRALIEDTFGAPLDWQHLNNKRASIITYRINGIHFDHESEWPLLQERMIDAMIRMYTAMQPHIDALQLETSQRELSS